MRHLTQLFIRSIARYNNHVAGAQQAGELKELLDNKTLLGVQGAYYYNTMFGPIGATLGYSIHTKEPYFYLNIGYEF